MVTHAFPRAEGDTSGAYTWRLGQALVARGHSVTVIAPADRGDTAQKSLGDVKVRRVRYASPARETLGSPGILKRVTGSPLGAFTFVRMMQAMGRAVTEEIRTTSANVVHAHFWIPSGLAVKMADRGGRQFLVTLHGTDVAMARKLPGGKAFMASVLRPASHVTAVSSYLATEAAAALGVPREEIPVIPMPLALGITGDPDAARSGAIFVGRLVRNKGVHHLLDALAIMRRQGRPLELTVIGDGPELAALKAQARALGLTTTFTGHVAADQVGGYLRDKRVFVFPALQDDLGTAVAEALTQGVPVVATRSGGVPDLFTNGEAGILVPGTDPSALAQAISEVTLNERYRVAALRTGRILADRLSPERIAEQYEALYSRSRSSRGTLATKAIP